MENIGPIIGGLCGLMVVLVIAAVQIVGMWKTFVKAGQPGWACLIPIYNVYVMIQMAGRPAWWLILVFIPFVNAIAMIIIASDLAKRFGGGIGLGLLLVFIPLIGFAVTGFGDAKYTADVA
jgi:hypothetical protein